LYGTQVTSHDGSERDPIDPEFEGLFRPESTPAPPRPDPRPVQSHAEPPAGAPEVEEQTAHEPPATDPPVHASAPAPVEDAPAAEPPASTPAADTGRLFRSQGVRDHNEAVLALAHAGRLRTLERRYEDSAPAPAPTPLPADEPDASVVAVAGMFAGTEAPMAPVEKQGHRRGRGAAAGSARSSSRGMSAGAVYLVVIGVTVLVAFANALLADGTLGWPTGVALAVSSVYAALTVRREDDAAAIIIPPVAFLIATLTAGQFFLGAAESSSLLNRAVAGFFMLAENWMWIIGSTVAALVIVLVRRRRA
jgi:hypothetical protein